MKKHPSGSGKIGEDIACGYLERNGYKIIGRNISTSFGELDIIAFNPHKMLIFIEVKSSFLNRESGNIIRQCYPQDDSNNHFFPEMHLNRQKIEKLRILSQWYSNKKYPDTPYRVDGMCIDLFPDNSSVIRYYENIIYS